MLRSKKQKKLGYLKKYIIRYYINKDRKKNGLVLYRSPTWPKSGPCWKTSCKMDGHQAAKSIENSVISNFNILSFSFSLSRCLKCTVWRLHMHTNSVPC